MLSGSCLLSVPNPPLVGKVNHHSIELYWDRDNETYQKGDKRYVCMKKTVLFLFSIDVFLLF